MRQIVRRKARVTKVLGERDLVFITTDVHYTVMDSNVQYDTVCSRIRKTKIIRVK